MQSQHRPSLTKPLRLKVPVYSDPVKLWNLHKADWKRFYLLTVESVERLPPPDTTNIEKAYQEFCESLLSAAEQYISTGCHKNYVPFWVKECEPQWGMTLMEPLRPYFHGSNRRGRSDGKRL